MPSAPAHACAGCGIATTAKGRCVVCASRMQDRRGTTAERGYGSRWQRRAIAFRKRHPFCGDRPNGLPPVMSRCREERIVSLAQQVDHVVPHKMNPKLMWDEQGNWQSLCSKCGAAKSQAGL